MSAGPRTGTAVRRFGLGYALRAIARDRATIVVHDVLRRAIPGTIDAVGADHLDLLEHPLDAVPRREAVQGVRAIPFTAVVCIATT